MRALARLLAVTSLASVLLTSHGALAQASEAVATTHGPVVVDARWIEGTPRRAEVDLVRGATRLRAYEGRTVRTAAAAIGDVVALGYYHGGPEPFAGVVLVDLATGTRVTSELPVAGAASPHRPAGLVIAAEAAGFAIVLQEQQADPSADVLSTFARLGLDGRPRTTSRSRGASPRSRPHRAAPTSSRSSSVAGGRRRRGRRASAS